MDDVKTKCIVSMMSMLHEGMTTKEIREMLDIIAKCSFLAILRNESIPAGDVDFSGSMEGVAVMLSDSVQFTLMDYIESLKRPNNGTVNADEYMNRKATLSSAYGMIRDAVDINARSTCD